MSMFNYDPTKDGVITAIRIYYGKNRTSMADLAFCFGGKVTIEWTNIAHRETYQKGINGYTFIFDEREKNNFDSFVKSRKV